MNAKVFFKAILYILFFIILMMKESSVFHISVEGRWTYFLELIIIITGLADIIRKKKNNVEFENKDENIDLIKRIICPYLVLTGYSVITSVSFNHFSIVEIIRTGLYWMIPTVMAAIIFLELGEQSIRVLFNCILFNYGIIIIKCLNANGLGYFFRLSTYTDNYKSILEVHEIGLTAALFIIYFWYEHLIFNEKLNKQILLGIILMLLCGKRIAWLGIIVVILLQKVFINKKMEFTSKQLNFFSVSLLLFSFIYIYAIKNGIIDTIVYKYQINTMSRIETWHELSHYYEVSPFYFGNGIGFSMYHLKNLDGIMINGFKNKVGDVHNDILKTYIDAGFVMYVWYMWYIFKGNIFYFVRRNTNKTATIYFLIMLYTFFLMMTDNVMRYDIYLMTLYLIPINIMNKERHLRTINDSKCDNPCL